MSGDDSRRCGEDGGREAPPVVCRKLRTKVAFGSPHPGLRDWRYGDSTTAVYWCLVTMETGGPDDGFAHPHCCQAGRGCFVPPADAEGGEIV
jgi:hypothetical protein